MAKKIETKNIIVEMDGDEMTRVMWTIVKEKLLGPHIDINVEYYDLGLANRDATGDTVTFDSAHAAKKHGVAVKCATITPNAERVAEYALKQEWKSPNGTIRAILDGTVFRCPILTSNIHPTVATWKKPIIVGRHAYGDVYKNTEFSVEGPGRAELVFTDASGKEISRQIIHTFTSPGIIQGIHNIDSSIAGFARACFEFALDRKIDLWFGAKDTISKVYDGRFKTIFERTYADYRHKFQNAGIAFNYTLIDDTIARIMRSEGGMLWACKNYDGDVFSDMVAASFGSLAMMTSVLVSPGGQMEFEAAHGTVQRHYYKYLKGEKTSTNSMALIFAWTGALRKRGTLDNTPKVVAFADALEKAALATIEAGFMTGDLAKLSSPPPQKVCNTEEFIDEIARTLDKIWSS
jgi:isocitrate dehydrogenase